VLLEARCETDFVARTDVFQALIKDLGMHIAAASPRYLERADVPESLLEQEREVYLAQAKELGKPEQAFKKIVEGKIEKFYADLCLLEQPFVKDQKKPIKELLLEASAQLGETVSIQRFALYRLGDS
jgi:elongation factor Ts